jgi:hypothetical protein
MEKNVLKIVIVHNFYEGEQNIHKTYEMESNIFSNDKGPLE